MSMERLLFGPYLLRFHAPDSAFTLPSGPRARWAALDPHRRAVDRFAPPCFAI